MSAEKPKFGDLAAKHDARNRRKMEALFERRVTRLIKEMGERIKDRAEASAYEHTRGRRFGYQVLQEAKRRLLEQQRKEN